MYAIYAYIDQEFGDDLDSTVITKLEVHVERV
jgi:hypothetical protein